MKKLVLLTGTLLLAAAVTTGCMAPQTWPDYKRNAEDKIVVIQEKIGDGLKTGALSPDQAQMYLTTLKGIRTDDLVLRDKPVAQDDWIKLHARLDALGAEIDRSLARSATTLDPRIGDRILSLQNRIDDGRNSRRWSLADERDFQYRLDTIRHDYLRYTDSGRLATLEEKADIDRRLDSLGIDLNRSR